MISYSAIYNPGTRPYLAKVVSVADESYETRLSSNMMAEELSSVPLSAIYSHIDNIVLAIKEVSKTLTTVRLNEDVTSYRYAISGYGEIEDLYADAYHWFEYVYKNREPEEETPA